MAITLTSFLVIFSKCLDFVFLTGDTYMSECLKSTFFIDGSNIVVFLSEIYLRPPLAHEPHMKLGHVLQSD